MVSLTSRASVAGDIDLECVANRTLIITPNNHADS